MTIDNPLFASISGHDAPLSLKDLEQMHPDIGRRTIQRHLKQLIDQKIIVGIGHGRARRFKAISDIKNGDVFPVDIPLSQDSKEIVVYIDRPLSARTPIGYQRELLEEYQPNKTWYLSNTIRQRLHDLGDTGEAHAPAGTYGREILNKFLVDLSWASSHLEGNTYSKLDTKKLIEQGKIAQGKNLFETQMILNHKAAIEFLVENANDIKFNRYTLLNLHSLLAENLLPNTSDEGRIRLHAVEIGKSVYHPLSISSQLSELFDLILKKVDKIKDPLEQAFFMMVHIPYLQPFIDINKRTSRLAANISLLKSNLCPLSFLHVSEQAYTRAILGVYEMGRIELLRDLFVWAYERSVQEYLVIKQNAAEPSPLRLIYRDTIKQAVYEVVSNPNKSKKAIIQNIINKQVKKSDHKKVKEQITSELQHLHEGNIARYGLRPKQLQQWQTTSP
ncbi:MAG: Fic family protein [Coxiellaceae bacterium]|nr:Fic family protein [Coxiellaceae bacterium]